MKSKIALLMLLALSAKAEPAFLGYLNEGGRSIYAITPSPEAAARWVKIGDMIDGYSVAEFRAKEETLVLKNADQTLLLKLKTSKIRDSAVSDAEAAKAAAKFEALVQARTKLVGAQERLRKLKEEREKLLAERASKQKDDSGESKK
jgi:hypothetical protein